MTRSKAATPSDPARPSRPSVGFQPPKDDYPRRNLTGPITPDMFAQLTAKGSAGWVPLCAVLHWIMARSGTREVMTNEAQAWAAAVKALWPLICSGDVALIGLASEHDLPTPIQPEALTVVEVVAPFDNDPHKFLLNAPSHICCATFIGEPHWRREFNDKLYVTGRQAPLWTHLQVSKADVLRRWPQPSTSAKAYGQCRNWLVEAMRNSPEIRPKSKGAFLTEALRKFRTLSKRQFERAWHDAMRETGALGWAKPGPPSARSDHRTN